MFFCSEIVRHPSSSRKKKTKNMSFESISDDVWFNVVFYYLLPSDLASVQLVSQYFDKLLRLDSKEANEMWRYQLQLFLKEHVLSRQHSQYLKFMSLLDKDSVKKQYRRNSKDENSQINYQRVLCDIVYALRYSTGNMSDTHLNLKLTQEMLNTEWREPQHHRSTKFVFVGDSETNKTAFLITAASKFPESYIPTVFDNYSYVANIFSSRLNIGVWDTAGQEGYEKLRILSYPNTQVFVIMINMNIRTTFTNAETLWYPEVRMHGPGVPIILLGLHWIDSCLRHKLDQEYERNAVTTKDCIELCKKLRFHAFIESHAADASDLVNAFDVGVAVGASIVFNRNGLHDPRLPPRTNPFMHHAMGDINYFNGSLRTQPSTFVPPKPKKKFSFASLFGSQADKIVDLSAIGFK